MNLADLHPDGRRIALKAVECAASGEVLPDDDEFGTICGIDLERFRNVALTLPAATDLTEEQWLALNNAMLWLVAYPHHKDAAMKGFGLEPEMIARAHINIRYVFGRKSDNFLDLIE